MPASTPTATPTQTPSHTPTPTVTATRGPTDTATPAGGRIKNITFEDGSLTHPTSGAETVLGTVALKMTSPIIGPQTAPLAVGTVYRAGLHQKRGTGGDAILEGYLAVGDAPFGAPFAVTTTGTWTTLAT